MQPELLADDIYAPFLDWGRNITYRQVTAIHDPATGAISEQAADTTLIAIVGPLASTTAPDTAAQAHNHERDVTLRTADLPPGEPRPTSRLLIDNVNHEILHHITSAENLTTTLHCRRT